MKGYKESKHTDLNIHLEKRLVKKLNIMIKRCIDKKKRQDALLICEGAEGEGKSNTSEVIAYYIKDQTKRDIHMFFRLNSLVEFAKKTENKIIIWDEPSLDFLSTDWYKQTSLLLIRMLMTCRKKRHFFIFNFVKYYKFSEYIVVDRALGMLHIYDKKSVKPGRFVYVKRKNLEKIYNHYRVKKDRGYYKYKSFGGWMPLIEKHFEKLDMTIEGRPHCTLEDYERLKDRAIDSIGGNKEKTNPFLVKYINLKSKVGKLKLPIPNQTELAEKLGVTRKTIYSWGLIDKKNSEIEGTS